MVRHISRSLTTQHQPHLSVTSQYLLQTWSRMWELLPSWLQRSIEVEELFPDMDSSRSGWRRRSTMPRRRTGRSCGKQSDVLRREDPCFVVLDAAEMVHDSGEDQ